MLRFILLTPERLRTAMESWERDFRAGKCRPVDEMMALPVDKIADENTTHVWDRLKHPEYYTT